jgi:ABC-2 type transport system ATP-binding protein
LKPEKFNLYVNYGKIQIILEKNGVFFMEYAGDCAISIRNLRMSYGEKNVLKGIDLDVYKGQIIGYIGPNGAGKSTTVKIMLGLVQGYTGEIKIFGQDISNGDIEYKRRIGYVPEIAEIYDNLTAREYLTFIGELYGLEDKEVDEKARKLMKNFGIEEVYDSRISSYSKGMKQKVLIISSLLHNPDILFLDEPLGGLDANSVMVVKEVLAYLAAQGKTIFYSSHIMDVVEKISSRIILLNDGQIVADGSFEELKDKCSEGSLEEIFNQLTGFNEHKSIAEEFVSIVQEVH